MKPQTFGTKATAALFALFDRAKLSGGPKALARETIAPDMVALLDELAQKARIERKAPKTLTQRAGELESVWLDELAADPAMRGVDVGKALAEAQFWCRNNGRVCTRKFFTNWLLNPKHRAVLNGGGPTTRPQNTAPAGWLSRLRTLYPDAIYFQDGPFAIKVESDYAFSQLPAEVRKKL